ncbi:MAG: DNA primase [Actinomycetota bacterium]|nr:DNA primase [Actinomycetota bacterium]
MAGRIRQDDVEAVKERTDLVKLVAQYLTLKKSGHDSMSGLCPFHQEKTPSFSVSPSKQVFYCFGCAKGGDAITFLRELEHLSYVEAVERLAQQAGVELRYEGDSPTERRAAARRAALIKANEEAATLFQQVLLEDPRGAEARTYLAQRGIGDDAVAEFGIGYAPTNPDFLLRKLSQARDLSPEILLEAGLATRSDEGGVRDRFRGRITFPIHDLQGRAIGFGARVLPTDPRAGEQAKYLNSAETPIYKKNEVLYNLHRARKAIARTGEVFVVEGYTDVIGLSQAGVENVVATCGTALGEGHFRLFARFAQRAVLSFDSDEAGARAAERAFRFVEEFPVQAVVMIMPQGLDPADFVVKHGAEAVREAAAGSRPLVEYMVRRIVGRHELDSVEGRAAAVADVLPILETLSDPVRRSEYGHQLAELAGVSEASVMQSLDSRLGGHPKDVAKAIKRTSAQEKVEREALKLLVRDADTYRELAAKLTQDHFQSSSNRRLFEALIEAEGNVSALAGGADEKLAAAISALALEPLKGELTAEYMESVWGRLQMFLLEGRSDALRLRVQKLNPTKDPDYEGLFRELVAVDGDLLRLRQGLHDVV